jgi:hypothetical protein
MRTLRSGLPENFAGAQSSSKDYRGLSLDVAAFGIIREKYRRKTAVCRQTPPILLPLTPTQLSGAQANSLKKEAKKYF